MKKLSTLNINILNKHTYSDGRNKLKVVQKARAYQEEEEKKILMRTSTFEIVTVLVKMRQKLRSIQITIFTNYSVPRKIMQAY